MDAAECHGMSKEECYEKCKSHGACAEGTCSHGKACCKNTSKSCNMKTCDGKCHGEGKTCDPDGACCKKGTATSSDSSKQDEPMPQHQE
jgi:hypothetical protein